MSLTLKVAGGLAATVVVTGLGYLCWPQVKPTWISAKSAVEQPVFVIASNPKAPTPSREAATTGGDAPAFTVASASSKPAPPPRLTGLLTRGVAFAAPADASGPMKPASPAAPVAAEAQTGLDKLAAALKSGGQMKSTASLLGPIALADPTRAPAVDSEAAQMSARGLAALANGDIAGARLWLERAAEAGDPRAYVGLGDAYNPGILARLGVIGAPGDPARARDYYQRALAAGLEAAHDRLTDLDAHSN